MTTASAADRRPAWRCPCSAAARGWCPRVAGVALMAASATTRFGVFEAGLASARDPKYTVVPQKERLREAAGGPRRRAGPASRSLSPAR